MPEQNTEELPAAQGGLRIVLAGEVIAEKGLAREGGGLRVRDQLVEPPDARREGGGLRVVFFFKGPE